MIKIIDHVNVCFQNKSQYIDREKKSSTIDDLEEEQRQRRAAREHRLEHGAWTDAPWTVYGCIDKLLRSKISEEKYWQYLIP